MAREARITVRTGDPIGPINANVYGHFIENLGQCIYPGTWVGDSGDVPNIEGFRQDVVDAFRAVDAPVVRWPGGCYADYYHWRDGVGPRAQRPRRVNLWWGRGVDSNEFGTDEFVRFCSLVGAEAYLCLNVGTGTPEEALAWLEYCNYDADSSYARMRADNGHPEPYGIKYWGVGNENYHCGGALDPAQYASRFRTYALYLKRLDPSVKLIACGYVGDERRDWKDWNLRVLEKLRDYLEMVDYLSIHYFFKDRESPDTAGGFGRSLDFSAEQYLNMLSDVQNLEHKIRQTIDVVDFLADGRKDIGIAVDEWAPWYSDTPAGLYQQNTLRDALLTGAVFNVFNRYSSKVRMANIAQSVNVLGTLCLTRGERTVLTPTFYVYQMYKGHMGNTAVRAVVDSPVLKEAETPLPFAGEPRRPVDALNVLDVSASINADKDEVIVTVVNQSLQDDMNVEIELEGMPAPYTGEMTVLTAWDVRAYNDFDSTPSVVPAVEPLEASHGETINYRARKHSVSSLLLRSAATESRERP